MYNFCSYLPIIKQLTSLFDFKNIEYNNIVNTIKDKKNVVMYLGGREEGILNIDNLSNKSLISIKNKTGIFKIALINGIDIIPVYLFFNKNITNNNKNNLIYNLFINFINFYLYKPTLTVVGKPIKVNKIINPTYDDILILRNKYINSLKYLFDKYKILFKWSEKELEIY